MDDRLLFLMSKAHHKITTYLKKKYIEQDVQLSPGQLGILFLLDRENLKSMSEMSRILEIDNSAITRLVDRLEASGLVARQANPEDRRQFRIGLTEKGREQSQKAKSIARMANEKIKEGFTESEIEIFKRVMASVFTKFR